MIRHFYLAMMLTIMLLFPNTSGANTLSSYIDRYCSKNCVGAGELLVTVKYVSTSLRVSETMILAIIHTESNFNKIAKSKSNAIGLMQVIPRWHKEKFITGLSRTNTLNNVLAGALVYKKCLSKHKQNVKRALSCYSGYNEDINPKYVSKVLTNQVRIKRLREYVRRPHYV
jgi:soluble lytic murein transglycosylase-like protein